MDKIKSMEASYMLTKPILTILMLFLSFSIREINGQQNFNHKIISDNSLYNETQVSLHENNQLIGFGCYTKIPLISSYVIHALYVYPQYRNKGYGSQLVLYLCDYLKKQYAKNVYIQPGAFELERRDSDETRERKTKILAGWYKRFGFKKVGAMTAKAAIILYKVLGINENSNYLMIKNLK